MKKIALVCLITLFCSIEIHALSSKDSLAINKIQKKNKAIFVTSSLGFISITHIGLYQLWYKDYPSSKFHFINDNKEWQQMDKCGHAFSAYYLGVFGTEMAKQAGYKGKKAIWYGGLLGTLFQTPIEVWDGLSAEWGASVGDIIANSLGTTLVIGQNLLWDEQRIQLKYSFHRTPYAPIRPNTLGNGLQEEFLKDYNGQTYWIAANIKSFLKESNKCPSWLNISIGYGSEGILGGFENRWRDKNGTLYSRTDIQRIRQFYLAPDIDFTKIKTKRKGLKILLNALNCIKFPSPAFEVQSTGKAHIHWIYF